MKSSRGRSLIIGLGRSQRSRGQSQKWRSTDRITETGGHSLLPRLAGSPLALTGVERFLKKRRHPVTSFRSSPGSFSSTRTLFRASQLPATPPPLRPFRPPLFLRRAEGLVILYQGLRFYRPWFLDQGFAGNLAENREGSACLPRGLISVVNPFSGDDFLGLGSLEIDDVSGVLEIARAVS